MTTLNPKLSVLKVSLEDIHKGVLAAVLEIQKSNSYDVLQDYSKGFLFTIWSESELKELLENGSELYLARDAKQFICGYALISPVSVLVYSLESAIGHNVSISNISSDSKYLYQIAIRNDLCQSGLGTQLLNQVEKDNFGKTLYLDLMEAPCFNKASFKFFSNFGYKKQAEMLHSNYRGLGTCRWAILQKIIENYR